MEYWKKSWQIGKKKEGQVEDVIYFNFQEWIGLFFLSWNVN